VFLSVRFGLVAINLDSPIGSRCAGEFCCAL
jgi:hypothetical protein